MKSLFAVIILAGITLIGLAAPAAAQVIPNVRGLAPFTAQTQYMSLPGFLRWQYFEENQLWISRAEATSIVIAQLQSPTVAGTTETTPTTAPAAP
ncbi:MAG: hypothetical protein ACYDBB_23685 [Armatimonadota bacterium]